MQPYLSDVQALEDIVKINRQPVAIKMVRDESDLDQLMTAEYDAHSKCRYCQAVMRASRGDKVVLSAANISCAAAAAAFGFSSLHPKLASGAAHHNVGTFGTQAAAHKMMSDMPRLDLGEYRFLMISPLGTCEFEPDVVLVEAEPEKLMWLVLAAIYTTGERLQFSTSVVQATCVDSTIVPFKTGQPNATLGCTGCREATDLEPTENLLGIPFDAFPQVIANLKNMREIIVKNRGKSIYERFIKE